jgi:predicted nucleic acid-binding Zn ribbon protein
MVSKEKLKQQVEKTATALKGAGKNIRSNKKTSSGKGRNKAVHPHRHCRMCHVPIDLKREPPICGEQKCDDDWAKNKKNEKMVRIAFFVFAAVFLIPLILQGFNAF